MASRAFENGLYRNLYRQRLYSSNSHTMQYALARYASSSYKERQERSEARERRAIELEQKLQHKGANDTPNLNRKTLLHRSLMKQLHDSQGYENDNMSYRSKNSQLPSKPTLLYKRISEALKVKANPRLSQKMAQKAYEAGYRWMIEGAMREEDFALDMLTFGDYIKKQTDSIPDGDSTYLGNQNTMHIGTTGTT